MTTIITKNGSGAPTAGQLSQGELAVDLTNKELYTKSGSTVIKIGGTGGGETGTFTDLTATSSFTSPGIDDNATSTAITIDANENVGIGTDNPLTKLDVLGPISSATYPHVMTVADTAAFNVTNNGGGIGFAYEFDAAENLAIGPIIQGVKENNNPGVYGSALRFLTRAHGSNPAEAMRITSSGNVGIGTDDTGNAGFSVSKANVSNNVYSRINGAATVNEAGLQFADQNTLKWTIYKPGNSNNLAFFNHTGGSTAMTLDASGTTTVTGGFEAAQAGAGAGAFAAGLNAGTTGQSESAVAVGNAAGFSNQGANSVAVGLLAARDDQGQNAVAVGREAGKTSQGAYAVSAGYQAGLSSQGLYTVAVGREAGKTNQGDNSIAIGKRAGQTNQGANGIIINSSGFARNSNIPGHIDLNSSEGSLKLNPVASTWTFAGGDVTVPNDSLLVGQTSTNIANIGAGILPSGRVRAAHQDGVVLELNRKGTDGGLVNFYNDTVVCGVISCSGLTTSYGTSSDERLKENIVDAPAGNVDSIKVCSFDWKADGTHQEYGFIAQELETVAPYAVTKGETDEDMWSVDYSKLVPMLVKEIQDLKAEVAALKGA